MHLMLCLFGLIILPFVQSYNLNKNIKEADANPLNTVKSDKWKRDHGLTK